MGRRHRGTALAAEVPEEAPARANLIGGLSSISEEQMITLKRQYEPKWGARRAGNAAAAESPQAALARAHLSEGLGSIFEEQVITPESCYTFKWGGGATEAPRKRSTTLHGNAIL